MKKIPGFQQTSLHTWGRRIGAQLRARVANRFVPSPRVHLVQLGGHRFKRIRFLDAWRPGVLARILERTAPLRIFPEPIAHFENELLVEYIAGEIPDRFHGDLTDRLAGFFAHLYGAESHAVSAAGSGHATVLRRDLDFLRQVGVLAEPTWRALDERIDALLPERLWVGTEYIDATPRNFVVASDGRLVGIDVDAIHPDHLIGTGVAKALLRASPEDRARFADEFRKRSSLDLIPAMPFVELAFLGSWTKICYLKGRSKLVDPTHFERLLARL